MFIRFQIDKMSIHKVNSYFEHDWQDVSSSTSFEVILQSYSASAPRAWPPWWGSLDPIGLNPLDTI